MDKTIALFINDLKYVTVSLEKDRKQILEYFTPDILKVDAGKLLNRFSNEYDKIFQQMDLKLHNDSSEVSRQQLMELLDRKEETIRCLLFEIEKTQSIVDQGNAMIGFETIASIEKLNHFMHNPIALDENLYPVRAWFHRDSLNEARELLKEIRKRLALVIEVEQIIQTVWKTEIFENESIELVHEVMAKEVSTLKYLTTGYWKAKKLIRSLTLNDVETVSIRELEQLLSNLKLREEQLSWLETKETLCMQYFGIQLNVIAEFIDALFLQMEAVDCLTQKVPKENRQAFIEKLLTKEKYHEICRMMKEYMAQPKVQIEGYLQELFPMQVEFLKGEPLAVVKKQTEDLLKTILCLRKDFDFFYRNLKREQEHFTLNKMRSHAYVLERLQQKCSWLKSNELKMISLLDTTKLQADSDWEELKMTAAYNSEVNFSEYKEADFKEYREETNDFLELSHMIRFIIEVEQPIHKETLRKRLMEFLGMKRMNALMKDSMESFLETLPDGEYELDHDFVQSVHFHRILFRCVKEEKKKRPPEFIAPREWEAGVLRVVKVGQEVTLAQIELMLMKALLMKRKTKAFSDAVGRAVKELKAEDKIVRHSGGFRIVR